MSVKIKRFAAGICALAMTASMLTACGNSDTPADADTTADASAQGNSSDDTASEKTDDGINAVFGDIRTEYNENLDLSDYPLTASEVPSDFTMTVEAESGELIGSAAKHDLPEASGGAFVNGVNLEGDELKMTAEIPYSGFYDLNFQTMGSAGRVNNVLVDDMKVGDITTNSPEFFGDTPLDYIYLDAGTHTISITPSWGYIDIDCLIISAAANPVTEDTR